METGVDTKVFALIAAGTTAVVGVLKKLAPKWVEGKEEALAQILPIVFTIVAKLAGAFRETDWVNVLLYAVGAGLGAGILHDKFVNPLMKGFKRDDGGR